MSATLARGVYTWLAPEYGSSVCYFYAATIIGVLSECVWSYGGIIQVYQEGIPYKIPVGSLLGGSIGTYPEVTYLSWQIISQYLFVVYS